MPPPQVVRISNTSITVLANMSAPFTLSCWVRTAAQMQAQFGAVAPTAAQVGGGGGDGGPK